MQVDPSINLHLNVVLKTALVTINQYFLHAKILGSWGLEGLELQEYQAAIRSMKHADKVMTRILSLNGAPVGLGLRDLGKLLVGENVSDLLNNDLTMETLYRDALTAAVTHCEERNDLVSRRNLESLLAESEHRIEWLRNQLGLIDKMGAQGYVESSSFVADSSSTQPSEEESALARADASSQLAAQPSRTAVPKAQNEDVAPPIEGKEPEIRSGKKRSHPVSELPRFAEDPAKLDPGKRKRGGTDAGSILLSSYFLH